MIKQLTHFLFYPKKVNRESWPEGKISQIDHGEIFFSLRPRWIFFIFYDLCMWKVAKAKAFLTFLYISISSRIINSGEHMFLVARKNSKHIRETRDFNCRFVWLNLSVSRGGWGNFFLSRVFFTPFDTINWQTFELKILCLRLETAKIFVWYLWEKNLICPVISWDNEFSYFFSFGRQWEFLVAKRILRLSLTSSFISVYSKWRGIRDV